MLGRWAALLPLAVLATSAGGESKPARADRLAEVLRACDRATDAEPAETHLAFVRTERDAQSGKRSLRGDLWVKWPCLVRMDEEQRPCGQVKPSVTMPIHGETSFFLNEERVELVTPSPLARWVSGDRWWWTHTGRFPARALPRRFDVRLARDDDREIVLELGPRTSGDKEDIVQMRLAFDPKTYRLRQVWAKQRDGKEETWDYTPLPLSEPLTPEFFAHGRVRGYQQLVVPEPEREPDPRER
jgi:hypothetical protein